MIVCAFHLAGDSNEQTTFAVMTDNLGYGKEKRRQGNYDVLSGKETFRYVDFIVFVQGLNYVRLQR